MNLWRINMESGYKALAASILLQARSDYRIGGYICMLCSGPATRDGCPKCNCTDVEKRYPYRSEIRRFLSLPFFENLCDGLNIDANKARREILSA